MAEELVIEFKSPHGPRATHVRSTLVSASLETLRGLGLYEQLLQRLPQTHHELILYTYAPTWLPIDAVSAYYDAWESLELSSAQLEQMGARVSERIMGSLLGTLLRGARAAGASPWIPLKQFDRLWSRIVQGGSVRVLERGPKEAVIESHGLPMFKGARFRASYCVLMQAAGAVFARTVYIRELPRRDPETHMVLASWV